MSRKHWKCYKYNQLARFCYAQFHLFWGNKMNLLIVLSIRRKWLMLKFWCLAVIGFLLLMARFEDRADTYLITDSIQLICMRWQMMHLHARQARVFVRGKYEPMTRSWHATGVQLRMEVVIHDSKIVIFMSRVYFDFHRFSSDNCITRRHCNAIWRSENNRIHAIDNIND